MRGKRFLNKETRFLGGVQKPGFSINPSDERQKFSQKPGFWGEFRNLQLLTAILLSQFLDLL
jgi:hypothetical protein